MERKNNELMIFENPEFGEIRIIEIDGEPWFVGIDVARALGYSNTRDAITRHIDEDDVGIHGVIDNVGREQQTKLINESGMYALIIMSELPRKNGSCHKRIVSNR
jgi:prophage antirepressor-like protein